MFGPPRYTFCDVNYVIHEDCTYLNVFSYVQAYTQAKGREVLNKLQQSKTHVPMSDAEPSQSLLSGCPEGNSDKVC